MYMYSVTGMQADLLMSQAYGFNIYLNNVIYIVRNFSNGCYGCVKSFLFRVLIHNSYTTHRQVICMQLRERSVNAGALC